MTKIRIATRGSALALAQAQSLKLTTGGKQMSQAIYLAEEQMELFRAMPAGSAVFQNAATTNDPGNPIDIDPNDQDTTQFNRRWTITPNTPSVGLTTIQIQVDWLRAAGPQGTTVRTVTLNGIR